MAVTNPKLTAVLTNSAGQSYCELLSFTSYLPCYSHVIKLSASHTSSIVLLNPIIVGLTHNYILAMKFITIQYIQMQLLNVKFSH